MRAASFDASRIEFDPQPFGGVEPIGPDGLDLPGHGAVFERADGQGRRRGRGGRGAKVKPRRRDQAAGSDEDITPRRHALA